MQTVRGISCSVDSSDLQSSLQSIINVILFKAAEWISSGVRLLTCRRGCDFWQRIQRVTLWMKCVWSRVLVWIVRLRGNTCISVLDGGSRTRTEDSKEIKRRRSLMGRNSRMNNFCCLLPVCTSHCLLKSAVFTPRFVRILSLYCAVLIVVLNVFTEHQETSKKATPGETIKGNNSV